MHCLPLLQTVDINCKGVLNGIAAVLPSMLVRKTGHIVNITSDAGRKVFPGLGVYSASKMFVEAISQVIYFFIYLVPSIYLSLFKSIYLSIYLFKQ